MDICSCAWYYICPCNLNEKLGWSVFSLTSLTEGLRPATYVATSSTVEKKVSLQAGKSGLTAKAKIKVSGRAGDSRRKLLCMQNPQPEGWKETKKETDYSSTKVPSKVWTLQAFNEGPLLGAGVGGEGAEGWRASTFRGAHLRRYLQRDLRRYLQRDLQRGHSKVPSKVPTLWR